MKRLLYHLDYVVAIPIVLVVNLLGFAILVGAGKGVWMGLEFFWAIMTNEQRAWLPLVLTAAGCAWIWWRRPHLMKKP